MKEKPSFDEIVRILMENPQLFKNMVEITPEILEMKWSGSESLLHFLIVERHYKEVEFLASPGAQVDSRKRVGGTPLHSVI